MKYTIRSPEDLGLLLRAARRSAKVRLDDLSHTVDVSKQTTVNVEKGKPTVQLGTVIRLLNEVGLTLTVDLPESALPALNKAQQEARDRARSTSGADESTTTSVLRFLDQDR
ncbi:DNA-binding XRE family transcriptional regulator [Pelomonas saccharophila]|uniref:DNA-binding XRE family transcriptional regulator n=1 Tax=Roseateles saccharophilus TaxID=304 RepID=A0ABU1YRZ6_ROSSA|nr:transcriptional regulator [Roseateles saccharophilus]MDR7271624.1 DNA-binding XRE family transcriptional regulator [Roseateles saccharophilus]